MSSRIDQVLFHKELTEAIQSLESTGLDWSDALNLLQQQHAQPLTEAEAKAELHDAVLTRVRELLQAGNPDWDQILVTIERELLQEIDMEELPALAGEKLKLYHEMEGKMWNAWEIIYTDDEVHAKTCDPRHLACLQLIHGLFLVIDLVASETIERAYMADVICAIEKMLYRLIDYMEVVHAQNYIRGADAICPSRRDFERIVEMARNSECIRAKVQFARRWEQANRPRYHRLMALICGEGVFLMSMFTVIFYFRARGLFPGIVQANEAIAHDESKHREYGVMLMNDHNERVYAWAVEYLGEDVANRLLAHTKQQMEATLKEALGVSELFTRTLDSVIAGSMNDVNQTNLNIHVEQLTNNLRQSLQLPLVNYDHPLEGVFPWLDGITQQQKGNFHEVETSAYQEGMLDEREAQSQRVYYTTNGEF